MGVKLRIATPMYGGMCGGAYTNALLTAASILPANGVEVSFSFMYNESLITRARNGLVKLFMKSDADYLMFIDADISFNPYDILKMIQSQKEVICGIYPKKEINWRAVKEAMNKGIAEPQLKYCTGAFVVNLVDHQTEATVPLNQPLEVLNGGTGFMLIHRSVFEKLQSHVPTYLNDVNDLSGAIANKDEIYEFFTTSIDPETKRLMSEDYHFCQAYRKIGGKIYAAPWCQLTHLGSYAFEGRLLPTS